MPVLALMAAIGAAGAAQQRPVEPRSGHLLIDAVVLDRAGFPVPDLKPEEIEVWIAGYRVPVEALTAISSGTNEHNNRSIILLLDDVTLDPAVMPRAREVARRFVSRVSPVDRVAVVTFAGSAMEPTTDRARLVQRIDAYLPRATGVMRPDTLGAQVLQTVSTLSRQLAEEPEGRKAIVAIGSAWLFDTPIPPSAVGRDLRPEWTDAMRALAFGNVSFYVVDPSGVGSSRTTGGSSGFARETGGIALTNTNDLNEAADRILRETSSYYLITVADPPRGRQADLRELDVRVQRRGVSVRARRAIPGTR